MATVFRQLRAWINGNASSPSIAITSPIALSNLSNDKDMAPRKPTQPTLFSTWSQTLALIGTLVTIGTVLYTVSTRAENRLTTIETNITTFTRSVDKLTASQERLQERLATDQRRAIEQNRDVSEYQVKILELFLLMSPRREVRQRTIELINELKQQRPQRDYAGSGSNPNPNN